ncbi:MAG: hypothetical protein EOP86_20680, partial [Verrucomicrobiaceae bacterium]
MNLHPPCFQVFSAAAACGFLLKPAFSRGQETLDQALDNPALAWTAGGDADWKVVAQSDAHAGSSVAEVWLKTRPGENYGFLLGEPVSWLETAATGPGLFTVWVRHNHNPYTTVALSVDGVVGEEHLIYSYPPGEQPFTGWYRLTAYVPPGSHPVRLTHRFAAEGTLYFDNPKVQADDARVLPPLGPEFLDALDVPVGSCQWVAGGGGEFRVLPAADAHDGVDALGSDAAPAGWDDWGVIAPWLQGDITGPVTLFGWQRSAGPNGNPPAGEWEHFLFFIPPGSSRLKWSGWGIALDELRELSAPEAGLKEALESGDLVFTQTGGVWKGVSTWAAPDGTDAAWTTLPAEGQSSLSTTVDGPALMRFFWTVQSLTGFSQDAPDTVLSCTVDGIPLKLGDGSWSGVLPAGQHTIQWTVTSQKAAGKAAALLLDQVQVTPLASVPLTEALDTSPDLVWTTGGKPWTGVAGPAFPDGQDAVVPPVPAAGEVQWLETRVTGPGRLTFQWAGVETMPSWYDPPRGLALDLDGRRIIHQNTAQPWPVLELSAGTHTLRWTVTGTDGLLRPLMLDQVQWTPQETPVWLEAVEQPAVAFFSADGNLLSLEPAKSFAGGSSLRLATTGGWDVSPRSPTLLAIANQPG